MNVEANQKDPNPLKFSPNWLIILFGIAWAVLEFLWRMPFTVGDVGGIYWFLYYFEKLSSPLAILALIMTLLFGVIALVMRVTSHDQFSSIAKTAGALFLASLFIGVAAFKFFQPETRHLDTLKIHNKLYYLTAYSAFDTNYALYRCDSVGIVCRQLYRSSDFMPGWFYANLVYYATSDEVAIEVKNEGEIYRYKLP
ncbi:MAG: hypothetical protein L0Z71_06665 [Anaerolineae bacterium]|nr:hypothetical protein [Anaerolineae bacterium]